MPTTGRFGATPAPRPQLTKPRKVRNGAKVPTLEGDAIVPVSAWAAQRWLRVIEKGGAGSALVEGLEYAREGQTKRFSIAPGRIEASIQGRSDKPYTTTIDCAVLSAEQWEQAVSAMSEASMYSAKLLAGELPSNIDDLLAPLGLSLFPSAPSDVRVTCTCADKPASGWCKHVCCASYLLAHRLSLEPFAIFLLRGLDAHELIDRLRSRRQLSSASREGATPIYTQNVPGLSDLEPPPLENDVALFWTTPNPGNDLDLTLDPPKVSHPLLRRLGPSPWTGTPQGAFPLAGLLASCYDAIGERALNGGRADGSLAAPPPRE